MLSSRGYSDKDQNIYAGLISVVFVILVIVSYVLRIIADQDNWTQTPNQVSTQKPATVVQSKETKAPKQPVQKSQVQEIKNSQQNTKTNVKTQDKNIDKKVPETQRNKENKTAPTTTTTTNAPATVVTKNKEETGVTKRDTNQKKEGKGETKKSQNSQKKNTSKTTSKNVEKPKEEPKPVNKKKLKSNNPFDYII